MPLLQDAMDNINTNFKFIVEFGVANGTTLKIIREYLPKDFIVFGFDSFVGLPEAWEKAHLPKGYFSTNGIMPKIKNVIFYKGWFEETLPKFIDIYGDNQFGLIHIDSDLYSSAKTIFKYITPIVGPDTVIVFDEWIYNNNPKYNDCEQKAFYEWVLENGINYTFIDTIYPSNGDYERKAIKILP
jgi:predicted O-methyltransferase YrrM